MSTETEEKTLNNDLSESLEEFKNDPKFQQALKSDDFSSLTSLTLKRARALVHINGNCLDLNGLTSLSEEQAAVIIGRNSGRLLLDGLAHLTERLAKILTGFQGDTLSLCGLTLMTDSQAEALASFGGDVLILNGLISFKNEQQSTSLAGFKGNRLILDGLEESTPSQISRLMNFRGNLLSLCNLKFKNDKQVKALAGFKGVFLRLSVEGLIDVIKVTDRALNSDKAKILISLDGLTQKQVVAIGKYRGKLELPLDCYSSLTDEQAHLLAELNWGELELNSLKTISNEQAKILSTFGGNKISLDGLAELTDEQAKNLSFFNGNMMSLDGLTSISDLQAEALANYKGNMLSLDGLKNLSAEQAQALAKFKGQNLDLEGISTLTVETGKAFAEFTGIELRLAGISSLKEGVIKELANYKCKRIHLYSLDKYSRKAFDKMRYDIEQKRKLSSFNINITCPDCKEWIYYEIANMQSSIKCTCDQCHTEFKSLIARFKSKRSKKWKKGRKFSIGYRSFAGDDEFIEFASALDIDFEFNMGDLIVFSWLDNELTVIQNETRKKEYYLIGPSSSCYIATYVYGSDSHEVNYLKQFRDEYLLPSKALSKVVDLYYSISPKLIQYWGNSRLFGLFCRHFVNTILFLVRRFLRHS